MSIKISPFFCGKTAVKILAIMCFSASVGAMKLSAQDLKAADIIQKHLGSIGTPETRAAMKNHFIVGASSFSSKLPEKKTAGKALIVSQDTNLFVLTSFMSQEYPFEKIGYFNDKPSLPFVTSGTRSPLGAFIADHETMLSNGLFTGSMSKSWAFADNRKLKGRILDAGTKKIDGRKAYGIDYYPSSVSSSEFSIKLYFDAETFHHVRTEYRHVIAPKQDPFGTLGRQTGVKLAVTESFSEFKTVDGMTLPHNYKISYLTDSNSGVYEYEWGVKVANYYFNQKLEPGFFTFETKPAG